MSMYSVGIEIFVSIYVYEERLKHVNNIREESTRGGLLSVDNCPKHLHSLQGIFNTNPV